MDRENRFINECARKKKAKVLKKRYFRIDQHLARHFVNYGEGLSSPPPFLCSQTITPL